MDTPNRTIAEAVCALSKSALESAKKRQPIKPRQLPRRHRMTFDQELYFLYRIHVGDYDRMLKVQGGVCAICKEPPEAGKRLCIDHDHFTDKVRGLLCNQCNLLLGKIENQEWIVSASVYLIYTPLMAAKDLRKAEIEEGARKAKAFEEMMGKMASCADNKDDKGQK